MSGRSLAALALSGILLASAYFGLKSYSLNLIHLAVQNAVLQKSPPCFPESRIRAVFSEAYERAGKKSALDAYRGSLLLVAQRLEKIQYLSEGELAALLNQFEAAEGRRDSVLTWGSEVPPLSRADSR